jgi:hypothetical protein
VSGKHALRDPQSASIAAFLSILPTMLRRQPPKRHILDILQIHVGNRYVYQRLAWGLDHQRVALLGVRDQDHHDALGRRGHQHINRRPQHEVVQARQRSDLAYDVLDLVALRVARMGLQHDRGFLGQRTRSQLLGGPHGLVDGRLQLVCKLGRNVIELGITHVHRVRPYDASGTLEEQQSGRKRVQATGEQKRAHGERSALLDVLELRGCAEDDLGCGAQQLDRLFVHREQGLAVGASDRAGVHVGDARGEVSHDSVDVVVCGGQHDLLQPCDARGPAAAIQERAGMDGQHPPVAGIRSRAQAERFFEERRSLVARHGIAGHL